MCCRISVSPSDLGQPAPPRATPVNPHPICALAPLPPFPLYCRDPILLHPCNSLLSPPPLPPPTKPKTSMEIDQRCPVCRAPSMCAPSKQANPKHCNHWTAVVVYRHAWHYSADLGSQDERRSAASEVSMLSHRCAWALISAAASSGRKRAVIDRLSVPLAPQPHPRPSSALCLVPSSYSGCLTAAQLRLQRFWPQGAACAAAHTGSVRCIRI